jgi:hypothetical protein
MKGLLWAENFIEEGIFFEDDETGVASLKWELYYSGEFSEYDDFFIGAVDYLKYYEERLK